MKNCRMCGVEIAGDAGLCAQCNAASGIEPPKSKVIDAPVIDAPQMFAIRSDLNGIGGWLILVAVGLAIAPFNSLHGMYRDLRLLFGGSGAVLGSYHGLAALILFEAITNTIFFSSLIGLNVLFYRKSRLFPGWMITFLCCQLLVVLADHLAAMRFSPSTGATPLLRSFIGVAVWIPYYLRSVRVKETFVN